MVIALDKGKRPLGFITERRARKLMEARRACVYRYFPFVLIIRDVDARQIPDLPEYRIKLDVSFNDLYKNTTKYFII